MTGLFITLQLFVRDLYGRAEDARTSARGERGSVTLEQVLITVGLFIVAGVVIAAITAAVRSRVGQIK